MLTGTCIFPSEYLFKQFQMEINTLVQPQESNKSIIIIIIKV